MDEQGMDGTSASIQLEFLVHEGVRELVAHHLCLDAFDGLSTWIN